MLAGVDDPSVGVVDVGGAVVAGRGSHLEGHLVNAHRACAGVAA